MFVCFDSGFEAYACVRVRRRVSVFVYVNARAHAHTNTRTVGRFRLLPASNGLAFACIAHPRLGAASNSWAHELPSELLRRIVDAARHWPDWPAAFEARAAGQGSSSTGGDGSGSGAGGGDGGDTAVRGNEGILRLLGGWELKECDTGVVPPRRLSGRGRPLSHPQRWRPEAR